MRRRPAGGALLARAGLTGGLIGPGLLLATLGGCAGIGPTRLSDDPIGYSRALSASNKRQTLLNVVRLRYADLPTFLDTTQVIAGYQLQRSVTGGFELFPNASPSNFFSANGSAQLQDSPTFTLQPVTGQRFAETFLRPLSPADLLPLMQGGLPVDVLMRLTVQSVASQQNSVGLERRGGEAAPAFLRLLSDLRRLQVAGLIGVKLERDAKTGADGKPVAGPSHVFFVFTPAPNPELAGIENDVRLLLTIPARVMEVEVVYGRSASSPRQIALLTRSMLGVLGQLAFQADVPQEDVDRHRTVETIGQTSNESRPVVVIHSGDRQPTEPFTAIKYQRRWFWVSEDDFDSKVAFTIVNILLSLAMTSTAPGTVITIPAG